MDLTLQEIQRAEVTSVWPLLCLAEESEAALRWSLANLSDTVYRLAEGGQPIGAATVRWGKEPCEIVELAIAPERQGQGLGRQLVAALVAEARRRGKGALYVGTANSSLGNIAFYQKCGFRMDHVRPDYFWYLAEPHFLHGIRTRDMIVFRHDLAENV